MFDGKAFGLEIVEAVKSHVTSALTPVLNKIEALERRLDDVGAREARAVSAGEDMAAALDEIRKAVAAIPAPVDYSAEIKALADQSEQGAAQVQAWMDGVEVRFDELPVPTNGKDADPELMRTMVADAVALIPAPQDGKSVTLEDVTPWLASAVANEVDMAVKAIPAVEPPTTDEMLELIEPVVIKAIAALPPAKDGASVTVDDLTPLVASTVEAAVKAIPTPRDGRDGLDVKEMFRAEGGKLVAVMSDGTTRDLGEYVGKAGLDGAAGRDGADGKDALGFDDMEVIVTDEGVDVVFQRGEHRKSFQLPVPYYRGVHSAETTYRKGSVVTWAGSSWIAKTDNPEGKPDTENSGWSLSTKRGRDAKTPAKVGA